MRCSSARPDAGTWCEAWTVRDIVVHQAGNAEELARVLGAHLDGEPVDTRSFEEREGPLRALNDADLWDALLDRMAILNEVAVAAEEVPADTDVAWTGRTMKVPWFAEHMREELVLHGWDITGDDAGRPGAAGRAMDDDPQRRRGGGPLLARAPSSWARASASRPGCEFRRHRRRRPRPPTPDQTTIGLADPEGPATLETDAAARVLLLWGRRPADPSRICSRAGAENSRPGAQTAQRLLSSSRRSAQ